jgi:hypothetical protein
MNYIKTKLEKNKYHFYFQDFPFKDSNAVIETKNCIFENFFKTEQKHTQEGLLTEKIIFRGGYREFILENIEEKQIDAILKLVKFVSLNQLQETNYLKIGHSSKIVLDTIEEVLEFFEKNFKMDSKNIVYEKSKLNHRDYNLFYCENYSEEYFGFLKITKLCRISNYYGVEQRLQKFENKKGKHKVNCFFRKFESCKDIFETVDENQKLKIISNFNSTIPYKGENFCDCQLNIEHVYFNQSKVWIQSKF